MQSSGQAHVLHVAIGFCRHSVMSRCCLFVCNICSRQSKQTRQQCSPSRYAGIIVMAAHLWVIMCSCLCACLPGWLGPGLRRAGSLYILWLYRPICQVTIYITRCLGRWHRGICLRVCSSCWLRGCHLLVGRRLGRLRGGCWLRSSLGNMGFDGSPLTGL